MIFNINDLEISDPNSNYAAFKKNNLICYSRGFFYAGGKRAGKESIELLLDQLISRDSVNFKEFFGAYRIIIIDQKKKQCYFFADNEGSCCFYYDEDKGEISDSLLELSGRIDNKTPNFDAITEFIHFRYIYSHNTICNEIVRTNAVKYYAISNSKIISKEKQLNIWSDSPKYKNLHEFMKDLVYASEGYKIADIITGGTDSRSLLAHLYSLYANFDLAIAGSEDLADVKIAKKIARKLDKKLYISDEEVESENEEWLRNLFLKSDGEFGVFSRYRLHKKSEMLKERGIQLQVGGEGGEFYKNSFLNQDFPFYKMGNVNTKKFYNFKINPANYSKKYFSQSFNENKEEMEQRVLSNVFEKEEGKKSKIYFRAGSRIFRFRMAGLINSGNLTIPFVCPLMEPDMLKLLYDKNPWQLEMNKWQRNEVSTYAPEIATIETDRGLTLVDKNIQVYKEAISTYAYLVKVGLKRIFSKGKKYNRKKRLAVFNKGRELPEFKRAMDMCKNLNILDRNVNIEELPHSLADKLMTIGLFYMDYQHNNSKLN